MKKKTQEEIIQEFIEVHGDKYDYSLVEYVNTITKVKIICPVHGVFEQRPSHHKKGIGCRKCYDDSVGDRTRKTTESFIQEAKSVHGDKFDYSMAEYVDNKAKIKIICQEHGLWEQTPLNHLNGSGCPTCYGHEKKSREEVILDFEKAHGSKYDYSLVKYEGNHEKVKIICPDHGVFEQIPSDHNQGVGCPKCAYESLRQKFQKGTEQFIRESIKTHGDKYDYSLVEYVNNKSKVKIVCPEHGEFEQLPQDHLRESGCPQCSFGGSMRRFSAPWVESQPPEVQDQEALLYVIEMKHKKLKEHFIKVGITTKSIKERFRSGGASDKYIQKVNRFIKMTTLKEALLLENDILETLKDFRYYPNFEFDGYTECLKSNSEVIEQIGHLLNQE